MAASSPGGGVMGRAAASVLSPTLGSGEGDWHEEGDYRVRTHRAEGDGIPGADLDLRSHEFEATVFACEGRHHSRGIEGHIAYQPAAFGVAYGCPKCCTDLVTILLCEGRVTFWQHVVATGAEIECEDCGQASPAGEFWRNIMPLNPPDPPRPGDSGDSYEPIERELPPTPEAGQRTDMTWDRFLLEFESYEKAKGLAPRTIENRSYMLRALASTTGKELNSIDIHDLRAHLGRGVSRSTMQTENDTYRAFFRFLAESGHRKGDLAKALPSIKAPRRKPRPFSPEQVDALLGSGAYNNTRAMILLAYYQGFRAGEVAAVHGHDIDLASNEIRVVGKADKRSVLPLHPTIRELALTMPRDGFWFPARKSNTGHIHSRSVSDLMTRAKRRAGITNERLTGHSLRHAYGTELVRAGVDLRTVQELMRHETLATTQLYTLINKDQMRDGINRLSTRDPRRHRATSQQEQP